MAFVTTSRRPRSLLAVLRRHTRFSSSAAAASASALPPPPAEPPTSVLPSRDPTILRLARQGRFSTIESLLDRRRNSPHAAEEPYLTSLIFQYASAGMIDHGIRAFEETAAPRTALSFNALLSACNRSRKHSSRVPDLFADLSRKYSIAPDKVSYGILIKSHCLSAGTSKAFPVLKDMEAKKIEITTVTYTTLLDSLYKERKPEEAEKLWKEMTRKGAVPDLPAYNVRAMHIADKGKPGEVLVLIDEMESAGMKPDTITYNYLISCYCKHGRFEDAEKVYRGLKEKGCSPNSLTYKILVVALCKRGNFVTAVELFNESVNQDKVPDLGTVKRLVEGLVKVEKKNVAKKMLRWLNNKYEEKFVGDWKKLEKLVGLDVDKETSKEAEANAA